MPKCSWHRGQQGHDLRRKRDRPSPASLHRLDRTNRRACRSAPQLFALRQTALREGYFNVLSGTKAAGFLGSATASFRTLKTRLSIGEDATKSA